MERRTEFAPDIDNDGRSKQQRNDYSVPENRQIMFNLNKLHMELLVLSAIITILLIAYKKKSFLE